MRAHECLKGVSAPRAALALGDGERVEMLAWAMSMRMGAKESELAASSRAQPAFDLHDGLPGSVLSPLIPCLCSPCAPFDARVRSRSRCRPQLARHADQAAAVPPRPACRCKPLLRSLACLLRLRLGGHHAQSPHAPCDPSLRSAERRSTPGALAAVALYTHHAAWAYLVFAPAAPRRARAGNQ